MPNTFKINGTIETQDEVTEDVLMDMLLEFAEENGFLVGVELNKE